MKDTVSGITFFILFPALTIAQHASCGHQLTYDYYIKQDRALLEKRELINEFTGMYVSEYTTKSQGSIKTITVAVHVLYQDSIDNISDEQIFSGLDVLNEDFRLLNDDFVETPVEFQSIAADCEIEFCLATLDEYGFPTSGITRTQIPDSFDILSSYFSDKAGGKNPWDNLRYLNMWIINLTTLGEGIGGFAQPPSAVGQSFDGVVVDYRYWGRIERANNPPFHLGRTATHEVGHYLNLEHPWGLEYGCYYDDFVDDTPDQYGPVFGCPVVPVYDACTTFGDGLVFTNHMDYTYEDCSTMFTHGQKERMLATLAGPRSLLIEEGNCEQISSQAIMEKTSNIQIFPNPATNYLHIQFLSNQYANCSIKLLDMCGRQMVDQKIASNKQVKVALPEEMSGIYLMILEDNKVGVILTDRLFIN